MVDHASNAIFFSTSHLKQLLTIPKSWSQCKEPTGSTIYYRTIIFTQNLEHTSSKYPNLEVKGVHYSNMMLRFDREYFFFSFLDK